MFPPKNNAAVLLAPTPPPIFAPVAKSATSVQLVPSKLSVSNGRDGGAPPKAIAEVEVPAPPALVLPVFKAGFAVHEVPFHDSTAVPAV